MITAILQFQLPEPITEDKAREVLSSTVDWRACLGAAIIRAQVTGHSGGSHERSPVSH